MNYLITYMSYEENVRTVLIEDVDDENEALEAAYNEEGNYSGDNICKIIDISEV